MVLEDKVRYVRNFAEIDFKDVAEFLEQAERSDKSPYSNIGDKSLIGEYLRADEGQILCWGGLFGLVNTIKNVPLILLCESAFALSQHMGNQDLKFEDYTRTFGFSILGLYLYSLATSVLKSYFDRRTIVGDFMDYLSNKKRIIISSQL